MRLRKKFFNMARQRTVRTLVKKLYIKEGILRDNTQTCLLVRVQNEKLKMV
jgi:hypothetical protein